MAIFRVEKNTGYTVMSNHHLRDMGLTLKAKGLLSQMLSLPACWDYTLRGLSLINRESIDAIRTAVWELEKAGYIVRRQGRDEKGKMAAIEYTIYEQPQTAGGENTSAGQPGGGNPSLGMPEAGKPGTDGTEAGIPDKGCPEPENLGTDSPEGNGIDMEAPGLENPTTDVPVLENPTTATPVPGSPVLENPIPGNPAPGNPTQLNKEIRNKDLSRKEISPILSLPIHAPPVFGKAERKDGEGCRMDAMKAWEETIKENVEYRFLSRDPQVDVQQLDEILSLVLETACSVRQTIRIAGDDYPAAMVRSKFLRLDGGHIRYVMDCMKRNATQVRNMKQYLLAALFNATSTIENYYASLVNYESHGTKSE